MWFCPNCDTPIGDFQDTCDKCGTPRPLIDETEEEQEKLAQKAAEEAAKEKERNTLKVETEDEADYQEPLPPSKPRRERGTASVLFLVIAAACGLWVVSILFSVFTNQAYLASLNASAIAALLVVLIPSLGFALAAYALSRMSKDMHYMKQDLAALREKLSPEEDVTE